MVSSSGLTASILTRNSAERIAGRIEETRAFADEVIVGVDDSSSDRTFEIASELADVTYRFNHAAELGPARLLPFEFASGSWILSLDDDESMEQSFEGIREELLRESAATHFYFPRKWIVNLAPCEYLRAPPWFPDWQLRLFRNDASLVWKPPRAHSGYRVQGTGYFESRASILHFEPLWCSPEAREKKLERYRVTAGGIGEEFYGATEAKARRECELRLPPSTKRGPGPSRVETKVREPQIAAFPSWRAALTAMEIPRVGICGGHLVAEILAKNIGRHSWSVPRGSWPILNLAFWLLDRDGDLLERDGPRFRMPCLVRPGRNVLFLAAFSAPTKPGDYILQWDLVSEGECWFQACGSKVLQTPLRIF